MLGAKWWQRPEPPVAQARTRKPIEEKESYRWLEGYTLACEVKQACPTTLVVHVADREGDSHEWVVDAMRRPAAARADFLLRAKYNRRLAKGQEHSSLWTAMREAQPLGRLTFALARTPERPPRQLTVTVTAKQVMFQQARRPGGPRPAVEVAAVYAQEGAPPQGEEAVEWLLLTSLPVVDFASACTVVQWYRCRWEIALFFRVLKQGCQIEQLRLQTEQRRLNARALYLLMAWRIHLITMAGRAYPEVSCDVVFEPHEWQTISTMHDRCHPPQAPPVLRDIVRSLAQLGGFLARKGDGEPGIKSIWQGYQRLHEFIYAMEIHCAVHALQRNV